MRCAALIIILACGSLRAATFYVSPTGTGNGITDGNPASFTNAMAGQIGIAAGDTIFMRGGRFNIGTNIPVMTFSGSAVGGHVTWVNYPGEQPIVEFGINFGNKDYHRFIGIEFTDPYVFHRGVDFIGWFDATTGIHNEWIGCVFHDMPGTFTGTAGGQLVQDSLFYMIGSTRREHVLYFYGSNFINNLVLWSAGNAIELGFGGINIISNIFAGTAVTVGTAEKAINCTQCTNGAIVWNVFYEPLAANAGGIHAQASSGLVIAYNTVVAPSPLSIGAAVGHSYTVASNTLFAFRSGAFYAASVNVAGGTYPLWDYNTYFDTNDPPLFNSFGTPENFAAWKVSTGFDANSTASTATKPADSVHLHRHLRNRFRSYVAIFNWSLANNVNVDVSGVMQAGNRYELYNAQDYGRGPIKSGILSGSTISFPMTNLSVATFKGSNGVQPAAMSPQFGAFVLVAGGTTASGMTFSGGVLR